MTDFVKRAPFVTVEGVDGAGKSSHIAAIVETLEKAGWQVVSTREPGGTTLGEDLRDIILTRPMALQTEILLAFASRAEHLMGVIRPALAKGVAVVCDRFTDSTFAYQVGGREGPSGMVEELEKQIHGDLQPDLTMLFDLPVSMSLKRLEGTGKTADKFESQAAAFFERVRAAYLARVDNEPDRFAVIDSSVPKVAVASAVQKVMDEFASANPPTVETEAPRVRRSPRL